MTTENMSLTQLTSLDRQVAVITGGAVGIGLAIGRRFGEAGAHVVLADVSEAVHAAADQLREAGHSASSVILDVTREEQHSQVVTDVVAEHGRLDIWVNNAGVYPTTPAVDMTAEDWRRVMAINVDGAFFGAREAGRQMMRAGYGVILNIASTSAFRVTNDGVSHYATSKTAIRGLTHSLAREFGPHGVRVLGLAPVFTGTPKAMESIEALKTIANNAPGAEEVTGEMLVERYASRIPLRRIATPDDMALVATFAVSGLAGYVTGTTIPVDGGYLAV
jgi:NAD(P)-dependent dehydrogenase (short-subunit alcohol dehydrogenase family)